MRAHLVEVDAFGDRLLRVWPLGLERGGEQAVMRLRQRGQRVLDVARETGLRSLHYGEAIEAAGDGEGLVLRAGNCRQLPLVGAAPEGSGIWLPINGQTLPQR